jgi:hypothetical protein
MWEVAILYKEEGFNWQSIQVLKLKQMEWSLGAEVLA